MSTILPEVSGWVTLYMAILFFILVYALVCVFAIKGNKMSVKYRSVYKEKVINELVKNTFLCIRLHVGAMFEDYFNKDYVINEKLVKRYYNILDFIDKLSKSIIKIVEETEM